MVPARYSAVVLARLQAPVAVTSLELRPPGPGEVLVRMEACGLWHSDRFITGLDKLTVASVVLGHEGIGRVEAIGPGVNDWAAGDRVGMTFLGETCGACEWCRLSVREPRAGRPEPLVDVVAATGDSA